MKSYNLQELSVIMLEKHAYMRVLTRDVLRNMGIRDVRETGNPDDVMEIFKDRKADLLLLDWGPDFDGLGVLKAFRNPDGSPDPFVPVVMISGNAELRHIYQARDTGATEYLAKPITARSLYARICAVIERHRAFIHNPSFFGPDRRRRRLQEHAGVERRYNANPNGPERRLHPSAFEGHDRRRGRESGGNRHV